MNIISLLPLEVSYTILEYLNVDDLGRCLLVSKNWHKIVNCDLLWRKPCLKFNICQSLAASHIEPVSSTSSDFNVPLDQASAESLKLCYWAGVWNSFGSSPAYKWHTNKFETLKLSVRQNDYASLDSINDRFVVYSNTFKNLDVYTVIKCRGASCTYSKIKLLTSMALCFPKEVGDRSNVSVHITENHIIAGKCNILLVFERNDRGYVLSKAIKVGSSHQFVTRDIYKFVQRNFIPDYLIDVLGIQETSLWVDVIAEDISFLIDVCSNDVRRMICFDFSLLTKNFFGTWSDDYEVVRIYDKKGNLALFLENILGIEDVIVNDTLIGVLREDPDSYRDSYFDVWEMQSGAIIFTEKMSFSSWCQFHPHKEILYTLEAPLTFLIYKVTAWDIRSHSAKWVFEDCLSLHSVGHVIACWEVKEICGKYLVFWPLTCGQNDFVCLDSNTGECIYRGTRPYSNVTFNYLYNNFWLSTSPCLSEITVRSYL